MHVFAPEGITGDLTYGFGCTSAHDWGGGLAKSYVARFVGGVAIMDDGTVGGHYDAAGLLPDHDRTVASLAIAALSEGGWKIALRDVARLIGKRCRASLMIADRDAGFFECFEVDTPDRGRKTSFQHRITEKCRDWAFAVQQTPRPQTAILSDCPDEAAALTAVLTKHLTRPASDALVANIDFGGVEGVLCIYNETDCECFMAADQRALARLHHAIEQAALAQSTLSAINIRLAVSDRLLDQLPFGVVTLDLDCRVLSTNATGARLLEEQSVLLVRNERLFCADSLENQSLQAAIADAVRAADTTGQSEHTVIKLYGMDETKPWSLSVSALSGATFEPALAWGRNRPRIVLSISDRDPITHIRARQIASAFGLSRQEEILAARIAAGDTLARIAKETGRSIETLRTQLRAVFQKTEANSQSELVQLVLCAPVGVSSVAEATETPDLQSAIA